MKYLFFSLFTLLGTMVLISSCNKDDEDFDIVFSDPDFEPTDWTSETHSKDADPNFEEVFDNSAVKRLDFVITEDNWQIMLDDMTDLFGAFGSSFGGGGLIDTEEDPVFVPAEVYYLVKIQNTIHF